MFSFEFYEISKNTFSYVTPPAAASLCNHILNTRQVIWICLCLINIIYQLAFAYSKLTIETLDQRVKYVQSQQ